MAQVTSMGACSFGLLQGLGSGSVGVSLKEVEEHMKKYNQNLVLIVAPSQTKTLETLATLKKQGRANRLVNRSKEKLGTTAELWVIYRQVKKAA